MTTIHLEPNQIPSQLKGSYTGKKFKARVCETMTIPSDAGLWSGGTRYTYQVIRLSDGAAINPVEHNASPWNPSRKDVEVRLEPGIAVVNHSMFCGKDMGLTFYVHPDNAAKFLPAPTQLTAFELIVLRATASYRSSYGGRDRYEMARDDHSYNNNMPFPSRDEWAIAKQTLINLGLLNRAGAITPAGRNAIPSRY